METPSIEQVDPRATAAIRLTVEREEIGRIFPFVLAELMAGLDAQGIRPSGPWYARYFSMQGGTFDLEIGAPIEGSVAAEGRIAPGELPGGLVGRTVHTGSYETLHEAWDTLGRWLESQGHAPRPGFWETYLVGPDTDPDPDHWRTQLTVPLDR